MFASNTESLEPSPEHSHPATAQSSNFEEMKRKMEISIYENQELTSKLTKANEKLRNIGDAQDELDVLRKEMANLQAKAASAQADKVKADAVARDLKVELEKTMEQSVLKDSEMKDLTREVERQQEASKTARETISKLNEDNRSLQNESGTFDLEMTPAQAEKAEAIASKFKADLESLSS